MNETTSNDRQAYIITGPTSGFGLQTALELARRGTVILVAAVALSTVDDSAVMPLAGGGVVVSAVATRAHDLRRILDRVLPPAV